MIIVGAKLALAILGAVAAIVLARAPWLRAIDGRRFDRCALGFVTISRLAVFVGLYVVARQPVRSDVPLFYVPQGFAVLEGRVPYRDFDSSYAPLFPYVVAAVLAAWRSPLAVVLFAIAVEVLSLPFWMRALRTWTDEGTARVAVVLYATSAVPITAVAVNGGNHVWCATFLVASLLLARAAPVLSGVALGLGVDVVKVLAAVVAPVPLLASRSRGRWLAGFVAAIALVYGGLFALHIDPLVAVRTEAGRVTAGTVPYLVAIASGGDALTSAVGWVSDALLVALLVALVVDRARAPLAPASVPAFASLVLLLFMLLSKKAYAPYLVMAFFPICALVAARWSRPWTIALWTVLSIADAVERSAWGLLDSPTTLKRVIRDPAPGAAFLLVEIAVVASHVALAAIAWRELLQSPRRSTLS